jgi:hypothetical protein
MLQYSSMKPPSHCVESLSLLVTAVDDKLSNLSAQQRPSAGGGRERSAEDETLTVAQVGDPNGKITTEVMSGLVGPRERQSCSYSTVHNMLALTVISMGTKGGEIVDVEFGDASMETSSERQTGIELATTAAFLIGVVHNVGQGQARSDYRERVRH